MDLLVEAGLIPEARLAHLIADIDEIVARIVASIKTLRAKHKQT